MRKHYSATQFDKEYAMYIDILPVESSQVLFISNYTYMF